MRMRQIASSAVFVILLVWPVLAQPPFAQTPTVNEIMTRVAANQARSVEARKQFVYRQNKLVRLRRADGKLACDQRQEYTVTPMPRGIKRQLVHSESHGDGWCRVDDDSDTKGSVETLDDSSDGISRDLFPLTTGEQQKYEYRFEGTDSVSGRQVYRISFRPSHHRDPDGGEGYWKGEALIDAEEFQPVQVVTDLTAKIPIPVRILLGTNVRGVGFTVSYRRVADGVWFPASFGGEFEVRALFFFKRSISINTKNSDFQRATVDTNVVFDDAPDGPGER